MPRRNNRGRVKLKYRMSFKRMARLAGLSPIQRIKLSKLMSENLTIEEVDTEE